jgi:hypothetical protein
MSPWSTPFQVWQDIMEGLHPKKGDKGFNHCNGYDYTPFEGNAATRWGLAFEDAIVKLAEERYSGGEHSIIGREDAFSHADADYVTCHIDGFHSVPTNFILHEGKTANAFGFKDKWGEPGSDRIPQEYQIQVQHQMLCTGADECIVSVLVFPKRPEEWEEMGITVGTVNEKHGQLIRQADATYVPVMWWAYSLAQMGFFHQYTIKADHDLHALMLDKYKEWWTRHVQGAKPPEPQDYADVRAMITAPTGTIIVDPDTARWFKEFKDIGSEIGASGNLAKRRDQLKTLILDRAYVREHEMCPHDKMLEYKFCHGQCGQPECTIGKGKPVIDDESVDKWIFRDDRGNKLGQYGKNAKGAMTFR